MSKKALTLTIVIPAYNEENHLKGCLQAIANQTQMPDEVIVVDNNSSDKTAEVAKTFPFVKLVHEKNQGLRFARNRGMAEAKGEIIGRIDADSQMTPDWCKNVRSLFASDIAIAAVVGPCHYYDMPLRDIGLAFDKAVRHTLFSVAESPILYGSNMAISRSVWDLLLPKLCDEGEFFEDYDMTIHLRELGYKIAYSTKLVMGVSSRRLDDNPRTFARNMSLHTKTFEMHGIKSPIASAGKYIYLSTYPPLKLIRKAYDPDTGRISFKKAVRTRSKPRPEGANR